MALSHESLQDYAIRLVHIHCYKSNPASAKVIVDNGGVLVSQIEVGGEHIQSYVIES